MATKLEWIRRHETDTDALAFAFADDRLVGQVVRYDQDPPWRRYLRGQPVTERVSSEAEAREQVEAAVGRPPGRH